MKTRLPFRVTWCATLLISLLITSCTGHLGSPEQVDSSKAPSIRVELVPEGGFIPGYPGDLALGVDNGPTFYDMDGGECDDDKDLVELIESAAEVRGRDRKSLFIQLDMNSPEEAMSISILGSAIRKLKTKIREANLYGKRQIIIFVHVKSLLPPEMQE